MIGLKIEKVRAGRGLGTVGVQESHLEGNRMAHWVVPESETNMKKLMFAASAAICAAVGFADMDGVQSQNIVGYQNMEMKGNMAFNLAVQTFKAVSVDPEKMTLGDISVSDDWATGSDEVKTLKANGAIDKAYTYVGKEIAAEFKCPVGWYLTEDTMDDTKYDHFGDFCRNADQLPLGNGLLVLVGSSTTKLIFAGEVLAKDQPISLLGNMSFNITGNVSPVDIVLGDMTVSDDWATGSDELKTLTANGAIDKSYTYVGKEIAAEFDCPPGWYFTEDTADESKYGNFGDYCQNKVPVKAGQAFIVLVGMSETKITIPSAL